MSTLWFKQDAFVNGQWINGKQHQRFPVINPANQQKIAQVANLSCDEVTQAIDAAQHALPGWRATPLRERVRILNTLSSLLQEHQNELAQQLTREQGKPLDEARGEVGYAASCFDWFAQEARRNYGDIIPAADNDKRLSTIKQAIGVCAAITPWNFPIAMLARKIAPALAAGCTIIVKPSELTPLSALALAALAEHAGVPAGVINVVTTDAAGTPAVGELLSQHPSIRLLSFTGSTRVGKLLMQQSAQTVKRLALELGGNAPFIVFDDADLPEAVSGLINCKFRNAGQTCVSANRIFVQRTVFQAFSDALCQATAQLRVGEGTAADAAIGPLIDSKALSKVTNLVEEAISKGARLIFQGETPSHCGYFFAPTILTEISDDMAIYHEEIFGPVVTLIPFDSEQQVISQANATQAGLAAYFYTRDLNRSIRVREALEYGMVGINTGLISSAETPFGGIKQSGLGREGGWQGLEEYQEIKYICLGGVA
jgi:succinate-semialdehyde dehydrogenase/glutarate-semialdehyde dehydrogenase